MLRVIAVCLVFVFSVQPVQAKNNSDSIEDAIKDAIRDELDDDDDDSRKGKGRPDNPGEHGRDNAREKQCQNPGKGSKCDDDWLDDLRDEIDDDDDDDHKGKNKKNK